MICVRSAALTIAALTNAAALVFSGAAHAAQPPTPPSAVKSFRDCADCPEMVSIPAAQFVMGAAPEEEDRENLAEPFRNRSQPRRRVSVQAFAAGKFELTRGQYRAFAEATGRSGGGCFFWNGADFELDKQRSWRNPGYAQDDTHPAVCVSWEDASAYAAWLSQRSGKKYRLLSEAEWEYAARAGTTTIRYWGDDADRACSYANGADLAAAAQETAGKQWATANCNDRFAYTAPVGSFRANAFGLHDVLGNAGEWTQDCWNPNYSGAPADGRAWMSGDCSMHAVRSAAWDDAPAGLRSAYRVGSPKTIRLYSRGFRVAKDD